MIEEEYADPEDFADDQQNDAAANEDNIVASGVDAASKPSTGVKGLKEKRIDNDKRTTTPYMTKYERARVLGTRALQIRFVWPNTSAFVPA